jgi:hypothetical protein
LADTMPRATPIFRLGSLFLAYVILALVFSDEAWGLINQRSRNPSCGFITSLRPIPGQRDSCKQSTRPSCDIRPLLGIRAMPGRALLNSVTLKSSKSSSSSQQKSLTYDIQVCAILTCYQNYRNGKLVANHHKHASRVHGPLQKASYHQ